MNLESQVISPELAKRLEELAVNQESLFSYYKDRIIGGNDLSGDEIRTDLVNNK